MICTQIPVVPSRGYCCYCRYFGSGSRPEDHFSRERLRRVLRKKHLQNYTSSTSSHLHLCTITFSPISLLIFTSARLRLCSSPHPRIYISAHLHLHTSTSLLIFTSAHLHLCSSAHPRIYISAHLHLHTSTSLLMFTSAHLHLCSSSHPHIYISHLHLSLFLTFSLKAGGSAAGPPRNATLCGDRARRVREMQARVRFGFVAGNLLRRSCASDARNAGESAIWFCRGQPSAEIVHVGCAKCRRECDLSRSRATLCGDRACRMREMQARVRFVPVAGNLLRRSCVSDARNAGESAICPVAGNPLRRSCVSTL